MEDNTAVPFGDAVTQFNTYDDYLDSHVTSLDLYYLDDKELARQLLELRYKRGTVLTKEEFEARKAAAEAAEGNAVSNRSLQKTLASAGKELKDNFLKALAEREEANRSGKMTSVIFIRDHNALGQEVSGYIDYAHRLKTEDFEPYFSGKKRLMPRRSDLSFYNWKTQMSMTNTSPNYEVISNNPCGLLLKNRRDRKILNVDPWAIPGDNSSRMCLQSDLYIHVIFYDHITKTA